MPTERASLCPEIQEASTRRKDNGNDGDSKTDPSVNSLAVGDLQIQVGFLCEWQRILNTDWSVLLASLGERS